MDKVLRLPGRKSRLASLPCRVVRVLGEAGAGKVVGEAVRLRNLVQHGRLPDEGRLREVNDGLQRVVRRVLLRVLGWMRSGRYIHTLQVLETYCG